MDILTVRNNVQLALFECEIKGQLSDGQWENTRPYDHWLKWCKAVVKIGNPVGRNFYAMKDNYNLCSKDLLSVVGGRMLGQARLSFKYNIEEINLFDFYVKYNGWEISEFKIPDTEGEYWREELKKYNIDEVNKILTDNSFTYKDLLRELKDMKEIMRTKI